MFNTDIVNKFSYNINAVSGTLRKSHPKSKFCVRPIDKHQWVFDDEKPKLKDCSKEIVILQVMLTGGNTALIEYVLKSEFGGGEQDGAD